MTMIEGYPFVVKILSDDDDLEPNFSVLHDHMRLLRSQGIYDFHYSDWEYVGTTFAEKYASGFQMHCLLYFRTAEDAATFSLFV